MKRQKFNGDVVVNSGFKCDAVGCDYVEMDVPKFEYLDEYIAHLVGHLAMNCPKCGAPLLTQRDFEVSMMMIKLLHHPIFTGLNKLGGVFNKKKHIYRFSMDGHGKYNLTKK